MTDHDVDLLVGWSNKAAPRASIGPNWSRQPLGGVKKPSLNTQDTSPPSLLTSPRALESFLGSLSLSPEKWTLSSAMCSGPHPASLIPWWEEKPPSLFTFYSFTLVYFLSVEFVCYSNSHFNQRPLQRLLNSKPISDFGETLSCKDGGQRESLNTRAASTNPRLLLQLV